jgi:hypothetical protein
MATQANFPTELHFTLAPTDAEAPRNRYPVVQEAGSHSGCPVCASEAFYRCQEREIVVVFPAPPALAGLAVVVLNGEEKYAPPPEALQVLAVTGRGRWRLPAGSADPAQIVISYGFEQDTQMVSHDFTVAMTDAPTPIFPSTSSPALISDPRCDEAARAPASGPTPPPGAK